MFHNRRWMPVRAITISQEFMVKASLAKECRRGLGGLRPNSEPMLTTIQVHDELPGRLRILGVVVAEFLDKGAVPRFARVNDLKTKLGDVSPAHP